MSLGNSGPGVILQELRATQSREAWAAFLRQYNGLIYQACRASAFDADEAAECFLFACEKLSCNGYRRLLQFRVNGPASFSTWLRVVVRNLCLDWRRKQFGRQRIPRAVARMTPLTAEVYTCRYERGLSLDETFLNLSPSFPDLTMQRVVQAEADLQTSLSSRQQWLISARKAEGHTPWRLSVVEVAEGENGTAIAEPTDPRPNQESILSDREQHEGLLSALAELSAPERLLVRLRFEQELSLEQVAKLTGLGDAQRAHRRIQAVLDTLRKKLR